MKKRFTQLGGSPEAGSGPDQLGLEDGAEVVRDYMADGEWGLALEHLCCMIEEADLPISEETYASIKAAGQAGQMETQVLRRKKTSSA